MLYPTVKTEKVTTAGRNMIFCTCRKTLLDIDRAVSKEEGFGKELWHNYIMGRSYSMLLIIILCTSSLDEVVPIIWDDRNVLLLFVYLSRLRPCHQITVAYTLPEAQFHSVSQYHTPKLRISTSAQGPKIDVRGKGCFDGLLRVESTGKIL